MSPSTVAHGVRATLGSQSRSFDGFMANHQASAPASTRSHRLTAASRQRLRIKVAITTRVTMPATPARAVRALSPPGPDTLSISAAQTPVAAIRSASTIRPAREASRTIFPGRLRDGFRGGRHAA